MSDVWAPPAAQPSGLLGQTVLIIGGYGTFGGRLCQLVADEPRLRLLVAGRSLERAEAFCRRPLQLRRRDPAAACRARCRLPRLARASRVAITGLRRAC